MAALSQIVVESGNTEEIGFSFDIVYAGDRAFFDLGAFRLTLASAADPLDIIDFSSAFGARNSVSCATAIAGDGTGNVIATFSFLAPPSSVRGRIGSWAGNLQCKNPPHAVDLAMVTVLLIPRPTY